MTIHVARVTLLAAAALIAQARVDAQETAFDLATTWSPCATA
jgi:hypothetical protein